jgi:two-component system nitrate/nitrite sensor histidine kinase NarX
MTGRFKGPPTRTATRAGSLVALVVAGALVGVIGIALDLDWLTLLGLAFAVTASGATLLLTERHQDEWMAEEVDRLELFLHDGPVQSMSGIALMLDGVIDAVEEDRTDEAKQVLGSALEKQRQTIRSLRDLSFELEPVVLRDQGFSPAVSALAQQLGMSNSIQIDLEVDEAESLTEHAQVAIFQIIREALHQAIRRGPPTRITIRVAEVSAGFEAVVQDDAPGERRRASYEAITERARSLNGRLSVDADQDGGTVVRVLFPPYRVRR